MKQRILTAAAIVAVIIPVAIFSETILYPIVLSLVCMIAVFEMMRAFDRHEDLVMAIPAYVLSRSFALHMAVGKLEPFPRLS